MKNYQLLIMSCLLLFFSFGAFAIEKDTALAHRYFQKAEVFADSLEYDSAVVYYQKAASIYKERKLWRNYVKSCNAIGNSLRKQNRYEISKKHLRKAIRIGLEKLGTQDSTLSGSYNNMGLVHYDKGNYNLALEYFQKALNISLKIHGREHPYTAISYHNIGNVYADKGSYEQALEYHKKAIDIQLKTLSKEHPKLANSYNNIGIVYRDKGNYDLALKYHKKALNIRLKVLGKEHPYVAVIYNSMGLVYADKGSYEQALEYFEKALNIRLKVLDGEHPDLASSYHNMGLVYYYKGNYEQSMEYYQKALNIWPKVLGRKHPDVAKSYHNIGAVYFDKGSYEQALEYFGKAINIWLKVLGKEHPYVAYSYNNMGNVYRNKGSYNLAMEYYQKALNIWFKVLGKEHRHVINSYSNMGIVYHAKGSYDKALEYYQKALNIQLKVLDGEHPDLTRSYQDMGTVYHSKGSYDKALEYYQKALRIQLKVLGGHPHVAYNYQGMGLVYANKGNYEQALEYHQKALKIKLKVLGREHPDVAKSYHNMGSVYRDKGSYEQALKYYQKALKIKLKVFGGEHPGVASSYNNMGLVYYDKGSYDLALEYHQRALDIWLKVLGAKHPYTAMSYHNMGILYEKWNYFNKALYYFQKSIIILVEGFEEENIAQNPKLEKISDIKELLRSLKQKARTLRKYYSQHSHDIKDFQFSVSTYHLVAQLIDQMKNSYKNEKTKLFFSEKASKTYEEAIQATLQLYALTKEDSLLQQVFIYSEKNKAGVLSEVLQESQAKSFAGIPDSLLEYERDLKIDLTYYDAAIQKRKLNKEPYDTAMVQDFENRFFDLNRQYEKLIQSFETDYPKYYQLKYDFKTLSAEEVQKKLSSGQALIEYFMGDSSLFIFAITPTDYTVHEVPLDSVFKANLDFLLHQINNKTVLNERAYKQDFFAKYTQATYELYRKLLHPALHGKNDIKELIIIPDGALASLPFDILLREKPATTSKANYRALPYLIRDYRIRYHYSAKLLFEENRPQKAPENYIGFAPDYKMESPIDSNKNGTKKQKHLYVLNRKSFGALKYNKPEVRKISRLVHGRAFLGPEATEENYKKHAADARIIHTSVHGDVLMIASP